MWAMEKLYSKIIRSYVFREESLRPIASVRDLVIDPNNGKVVAIEVNRGRKMVISPMDITAWGSAMKIGGRDDIVNVDELVRVKEVWERRAQIFGQKVETEGGKVLGKVIDFVIDGKFLVLKKLYVAKVFLGLLKFDSRIILAKNIIEILPNKIVVKDDAATVKEEEKAVRMATGVGEEKVELCPAG